MDWGRTLVRGKTGGASPCGVRGEETAQRWSICLEKGQDPVLWESSCSSVGATPENNRSAALEAQVLGGQEQGTELIINHRKVVRICEETDVQPHPEWGTRLQYLKGLGLLKERCPSLTRLLRSREHNRHGTSGKKDDTWCLHAIGGCRRIERDPPRRRRDVSDCHVHSGRFVDF